MKQFKQFLKEDEGYWNMLDANIVEPYDSLHHHYDIKKEHHETLRNYTDSSHDYNNALWRVHENKKDFLTGEEKASVKHLDNIIKSYKTPHEITVHSGVFGDPRERMNKKNIVHHPAYLSTSLDKDTATGFSPFSPNMKAKPHIVGDAKLYPNTERHVLSFKVPKGHSGVYVEHISHVPQEKEFILPRGLNLKLTGHSVKHDPNGTNIHTHEAEIVP